MGFILAACGNIALAQDQQPAPTASTNAPAATPDKKAANANHPDVSYPKMVRVQVELIELSESCFIMHPFYWNPGSLSVLSS